MARSVMIASNNSWLFFIGIVGHHNKNSNKEDIIIFVSLLLVVALPYLDASLQR